MVALGIDMANTFPHIDTTTAYFPYPESSTFEFKRKICSSSIDKIYATICAFLNTDGGHIVFGVEDGTRKIVPLNCDKLMDKFILIMDNVIRTKQIISTDGQGLIPYNLKCSILNFTVNTGLLIITVRPTPGKRYTLSDGTVWYRLSASNYRMSAQRETYSSQQVNDTIGKLKIQHQTEMDKIKTKMSDLQDDYKVILGVAKTMEASLDDVKKDMEVVKDMLHTLILKQKEDIEMAMAEEKQRSWLSCFKIF
jgi:predicted HTH transcriptional regulator